MRETPPSDTESDPSFPQPGEAAGPIAMARRDLKKALPRRFFKETAAQERDGKFVLLLDGRVAKTPGGNVLALPTMAAARALEAEWSAVGEIIDPAVMPLTRIVNSAIDGVSGRLDATAAEIVKYAASDLTCYRAAEPEALVLAQGAAWDPVLAFARNKLAAPFICTQGVVFIEQPEAGLTAVRRAIARIAESGVGAPFGLAALHVMTTLTGSALLALAVTYSDLTPIEAWRAAHVDEDFEMRTWGEDAEAMRRRTSRWREMEAAAALWQHTQGSIYPSG